MHNDATERTVVLHFPRKGSSHPSLRPKDRETWLSMLEMLLESEFNGYTITITHDTHSNMTVEIEFSTIDDAVLFRLQH